LAKVTGGHVAGLIDCSEPDMEPAVALVAHNGQDNGRTDCSALLGHQGIVATPEHIRNLGDIQAPPNAVEVIKASLDLLA
jgi:hypothetical protein